ncbi:hypothetical protein EV215_1987 [Hypnocyclicus thermotrophus]|uniref:NusG domain-containing protein n=1 Tax=Hypnocyclicus thermotrophus TaxID=1627895 RepID=A0AA46DXE7_9FUSO|nr:NusG domain II-containing protein [Hypnocyclicus thermotrophus]TDT67430.1 hypothetical protein EV215_1987 [Hypnocyclicus thermotrophus]
MFKKGDIFIYSFIILFFSFLITTTLKIPNYKAEKIEIYVNNQLKYTYKLTKEQKIFKIPTDIGGVKVEIVDNKVRVLTSNSPKKLVVKQGFISKAGETLIGIPDKLLIKITGERKDVDYILQ